MYCDEIYEALNNKEFKTLDNIAINNTKKFIKNSIRFRMDDITNYRKMMRNSFSGNGTFYRNDLFVNMPFDKICFEYIDSDVNKNSKNVILCEKDGDSVGITYWLYLKEHLNWGTFGFVFRIENIFNENKKIDLNVLFFKNLPEEIKKDRTALYDYLQFVFFTFLYILNTKNIEYEKIYPDKKLNKKRINKGKLPLFSYHVLKIKNNQKKYKNQSQKEAIGNTRVHLCRGHFKHYTEENPLFGKYTGRYWWQPTIKGNKKNGIVKRL